MKYSKNFERDFKWYLKVRHLFQFTGKQLPETTFDKNGIDGKKAFYLYDSTGVLNPTKHPVLLKQLIRIKSSVNFHIKMFAQDRGTFNLSKAELVHMCVFTFKSPVWFRTAVENQKYKYRAAWIENYYNK